MRRHWRDDFIAALARYDVRPNVARRVLRYTATLQRLSEAQCNGDWPADNGERKVEQCVRCGAGFAPSVMYRGEGQGRVVCPDCRTSDLARAYVAEQLPGWSVSFAGDPRGCVVVLTAPDGREVGVPS